MASSETPTRLHAEECLEAIERALRVLAGKTLEEPFRLVGAINLLKGFSPPSGPTVWQLTFKPERLIPSDATGIVGAGGELIVRIDLARADNPVSVVRGE
ncbi:hypothetical protein [Reyranella sp.]|uniref:hypothetical protein n=1 Tax=Reyranella sp. TaxID=1929291 RepID=UPI003785194B